MILDVDIGNSRLKWRLSNLSAVQGEGVLPVEELDDLGRQLEAWRIRRVRASCVTGREVEAQFHRWCERSLAVVPEFARVKRQHRGLTVGYREADKLGVDRWLAMLAAYQLVGGACAVIDAGSALTVDFIDQSGSHIGGLILPGVQLMREALFARTQGVKVPALTVPQTWRPGCDTVACVENGMAAALSGLVNEVIAHGEKQCGQGVPVLVCGGDATTLARLNSQLDVRAGMVLDGLALAFGDQPPRE